MNAAPEMTAKIVQLYSQGNLSLEDVGRIVGRNHRTVAYHVKKAGYPLRARGRALRTQLGKINPTLAAHAHPTGYDIAWAAGIYEGEGSCLVRKDGDFSVVVCQKDRWLCDRLRMLFGGSVRTYHQQTSVGRRPIQMHNWRACGTRGRGFLMTIYCFLSPRRQAKAREVICAPMRTQVMAQGA